MSKLNGRIQNFLPKSPTLWITCWVIWLVTLWFLSEATPTPKNGPEIPHFDKIAHFGYFMGGAIFLSGFFSLKNRLSSKAILSVTTLTGAIVGALDEYHQTFTPGRTGNDPFDWLADFTGTIVGTLIILYILLPKKHNNTHHPK